MRTLVRLLIAMSVFMSNVQAVLRVMSILVTTVSMMPVVMPMFRFTLAMSDHASFDGMPMLTSMSVMRAASENRMQQHRRHRQNAGQGLEHEFL